MTVMFANNLHKTMFLSFSLDFPPLFPLGGWYIPVAYVWEYRPPTSSIDKFEFCLTHHFKPQRLMDQLVCGDLTF